MPEVIWPGADKPAAKPAWPGADKPVAATQWPGADQPQQAVAPEPKREPVLPITSFNWRETPSRMMEWWQSQPAWGEQYSASMERDQEQKAAGVPLTQRLMERAPLFEGFAGSGIMHGVKVPSIQPAVTQVQKILSPQSVSPTDFVSTGSHLSQDAAASIRSAGGTAARDTATTAAAMEPHHRMINSMPEPDRLSFIEYVEGNPSLTGQMTAQARPLADELKRAAELRETKLRALPSTAQAQFVDDYLAHFWQDPQAAARIGQAASGAGKQGSGASLKKRTVPTYQEGIAAGLRPLTTDPIEIAMRYVSSMDRFIAATDVLDTAKANGTVRYVRPKVMGASGNPNSFKVPPGYAPLEGRGAIDATGARAYAPEDWARVYNNFISKGFHGNAEAGKVYDAVQGASNAITSLELGLSGYHAFTMANEAIISDVARGISNAVGGKPIKGVGQILTAPTAPIRTAMRGHKAEQVYLGRSQGTPDMRRIVDLQTQAGGRAVGKGHAADYRFSAMGSYWTAFKRGALKQEMRQSLANIKAQPLIGTAKEAGKMIGRVMETVAQPIFEKYIPKIKNGAFYDTMKDWLEANPTATHEQQVAMARKIWDSIDNRFGEMVQDNIFWNKTLKQSAQLGMRSYSWNLGTVREIGGGAISAVKDPRKLSMAHQDYDPRTAYVVAMPIVVATANAVYQYLKTGQAPESVDDLVAGRTGGTAPGFGGRGAVDERASLPGYQKDVLGWYHDWKQEALNKQSRMLQLTEELLSGKDFQGHLLSQPDNDTPAWLTDYFMRVMGSMVPISVQQLGRGQKTGSEVSTPESMMGIRPAPGYIQDPEGTELGMHRIKAGEWKRGQKSQRRQQSQYGGPNE